jgi:hypothetical protein
VLEQRQSGREKKAEEKRRERMENRPKRHCVRKRNESKAHLKRMREIDGGSALKGQCNICLEVRWWWTEMRVGR